MTGSQKGEAPQKPRKAGGKKRNVTSTGRRVEERADLRSLRELEKMLKTTREELRKKLSKKAHSGAGATFREAGVWEEVVAHFEAGTLLVDIRKWLKKERGITTTTATLCRARQNHMGRRWGKKIVQTLMETEEMLDPLKQLGEYMLRVQGRYDQHLQLEDQLGVPLPEPAQRYLQLMLEGVKSMVETYVKMGHTEPTEVDLRMKHSGTLATIGGGDLNQLDYIPAEKLAELFRGALE